MKKIISFFMCLLIFSLNIYADEDNADSGNDTGYNEATFAFYQESENMWKVSLYVGKSDTTSLDGSINDFYRVGKPVFIQGFSNFKAGYKIYASPYNKLDYLAGKGIARKKIEDLPVIVRTDAPAIPVSHFGTISSVKAYFGDGNTLNGVLEEIGSQMGVDIGSYLSSKTYFVEGKPVKLKPEEIIPERSGGKTTNRVPWLIMYEPVVTTYLGDASKKAVAFSATEYALTNGSTFNWNNASVLTPVFQNMANLTHRDLPASVVLETSWLGYEALSPDTSYYWSDDRIKRGGGYGMRWLDAGEKTKPKPSKVDLIYRTDTDVITSFMMHTNPSPNRIDLFNPKNRASVSFNIGGITRTHSLIMPDGGSQYSWVKWHTPKVAGEVTITVTPSSGLYFEDGSSVKTVKAKIVDLKEKRPPDPEATDKADDFKFKPTTALPNKASRDNANWYEYYAIWHEHWVDRGHTEYYTWTDDKGVSHEGSYWVSKWVDEGWWDWFKNTYYLNASATVKLKPAKECPTPRKVGDKWYLKSGYSFNTDLKVDINTNAPNFSHYTKAGNVLTTFPEFNYKTYLRLLEKHGTNEWYFRKNIFSQWKARSHFTPLWYPDGKYEPYYEVIDIWTPDGMCKINVSDYMMIKGNIYDDWHISAEEVK